MSQRKGVILVDYVLVPFMLKDGILQSYFSYLVGKGDGAGIVYSGDTKKQSDYACIIMQFQDMSLARRAGFASPFGSIQKYSNQISHI